MSPGPKASAESRDKVSASPFVSITAKADGFVFVPLRFGDEVGFEAGEVALALLHLIDEFGFAGCAHFKAPVVFKWVLLWRYW